MTEVTPKIQNEKCNINESAEEQVSLTTRSDSQLSPSKRKKLPKGKKKCGNKLYF